MADGTAQAKNSKAELAFADYVAMGPGRSLAALVTRYQGATEASPTKRLGTLKEWSIRYHWQDRLAEASSAIADQMLRDASELDAQSFLASSRILNRTIQAETSVTLDETIRIRESVRKPGSKNGVTVEVSVSIRQQAERMAADLGIDVDDFLATAEQIAADAWKATA